MRRFATITLTLFLLLGLSGASHAFAQDEAKKDEPAKTETSKSESPEAKEKDKGQDQEKAKDEASKPEAEKELPIPPEVEAKLEAARRAVAEAIVAAQDAGLVKSSIDPPPILDILVTGRANDESTLKARTGVSPEVFGAWFTGYGTTPDINPQKDVRITRPDAGLKELYSQRSNILTRHIEAVRKAKGSSTKEEAPAAKDEAQEEKAKEDNKKEAKKGDSPKTKAKKGQNKEKAAEDSAKKDNDSENPPKTDAPDDDKKGNASDDVSPK